MPVSSQDGTLQAKFAQLINEKMQRNHIISALSSQLTAAEQEISLLYQTIAQKEAQIQQLEAQLGAKGLEDSSPPLMDLQSPLPTP
jgi:chromosome segregation ATPase